MSKEEQRFLRECAELAPQQGHYVELGCYVGGSLKIIAEVANEREQPCLAIDHFNYSAYGASSPAVVRQNLENRKVDPLPQIIRGQSHIVPPDVDCVAFLHIDTDHRGVVLNRELDAWEGLILPSGIIALHDYSWKFPSLTKAIDERLGDNPGWERVGLELHLVAFRKCDE